MDRCQGAESAMGSLITLLAVADILGNNTAALATYKKRLVLTALMGEPWGYMGSKRLLWDMYNHADTTTGLDVDNIEQASPLHVAGQMSFSPEPFANFHWGFVMLVLAVPHSV